MEAVMPAVLLAPAVPPRRLPESTTKIRALDGRWLVASWAEIETKYVGVK
jgi:hypothetical protein